MIRGVGEETSKESRTYGTDWGRLLMFKLEVAKLAAAVGPVTGKEDTC